MNAQQLKNSILQMAIQGKLVPQDPNDEPASVLIERIREEKEKLLKEKKIKKEKNPSFIFRGTDNTTYEKVGNNEPISIEEELPFEIPESWEWVRLGMVCEIARGGSPRPIKQFLTDSIDGINWIKIGDTAKESKYINSAKEKIISAGVTKSRMVHAGDFLLTNSMSFGRPYILNIDGCIHDGWLVISNYEKIYDRDFLYYMLSSKVAYYQFCNVVSGAVVKNLNIEKVSLSLFPLPPLAEQERIVTKLEELLPLVERYGDKQNSLDKLKNDFPALLKKSFLQEAVQGKLVPQDSSDEPASVLLERIMEEKQKLIKEGKIKKDRNESIIYRRDNSHYEKRASTEICIDTQLPFNIPDSWEWCYLGNIAFITKLAGFEYTKFIAPNLTDSGIPLFKGKNVQNGNLVLNFEGYIPEQLSDKLFRSQVTSKCLLTPYVGTIGNIAIFDGSFKAHLGSNVGKIELINPIEGTCVSEEYVLHYLRSPVGYQQLTKHKKATAQESISIDAIRNVLIPIPPFKEQMRIIHKVFDLNKKVQAL